MKYCETCLIFRPAKSAHCNICNNCVSEFDHHCIWLGTCVGKNNYPAFFFFVIALNCLLLTVIVTCIRQLVEQVNLHVNDADPETDSSDALGYMRVGTWVLLVYAIFMQLFTAFLLGFHYRLINRNETTNEFLKQRASLRFYTFREHFCFKRLHRSICRRRAPSFITNSLIRVSLLMESMMDSESLRHSVGGTPKKCGEINAQEIGLARKLSTLEQRRTAQISLCSSSKHSLSIDESSMLINNL